jgi:hypothetical protein
LFQPPARRWRLRKLPKVIRGRYSRALAAKYRNSEAALLSARPHPAAAAMGVRRSIRMVGAKSAPIGLPGGLSRQVAAEYIGVGTTLFDAMVRDGRMPQPFRVGARVIWDRHKLDAAFDALSDQDEDDNPWDATAA